MLYAVINLLLFLFHLLLLQLVNKRQILKHMKLDAKHISKQWPSFRELTTEGHQIR